MNPTITDEGRAAAGRIAEARQNVDNGATPAQARRIVRGVENPQNMLSSVAPSGSIQNRLAQVQPTRTTPLSPINTTSLPDLQSVPTIQDVPPPGPTSDFSSIINQFRKTQEPPIVSGTEGLQNILQQRGARNAELQAETTLTADMKRSADLNEQIASLTGSFDTAIQAEEGAVRPMEFITGRQAFLREQKATQIEALSAAKAAIDGNIGLAQQKIADTLEAEFGTVENQLDALKQDYTQNKDAYERIDKAAADERAEIIAERERLLDEAKTQRKDILDLMLRAADNGADSATLSRIAQAQDIDSAISAAGSFMTAPGESDIRSVDGSLVRVNPDGTVSVLFGGATGSDPISILNQGGSILSAGEASAGGKEVSSNFIEGWSKANTTLDQVESLANNFATDRADSSLFGDDAGIFSGIVGAFRSRNPLDVKAQTIKNQLNAIVPNLARGIYGEVGVLTDTDFERYAQTLPNLGSTQEVQDAVLGITLMAIKNSMVNRYEAELRGGRDVSGYVSQIEDMERRIGTLLTPTNMQLPETQSLIEAGAPQDEIQMLFEAGYEVEDVEDYYLNGGTSQSSGEVSFDDAIAASAEAIATIESGGNYQARGPVVTSGMYAGERAMGKYQIMPGNLPQWSREALGREVTEEEFMNSPQIQDQIFAYQFGKAAKQHGSLEDAASVWFSGRPIAKAGNAKDVLGTSVPQYVQNFRNNLQLYA